MSSGKYLGKIESAWFGIDSDRRYGLHLTLATTGGNVDWFIAANGESERSQWKIAAILQNAKKNDIAKLPGTPIEATFEGNLLKDWRILHEVL